MSIIRSRLLDEAGVPHGFGTAAASDAELPVPIFTLRQVHGHRIVVIARPSDRGNGTMESVPVPEQPHHFAKGDALISTVPGTFVGVRTADCLPVLLTDPRSGIAAAVHCGWRGLALGIAGETVRAVSLLSGNPPSGFLAALGPAIGQCCYEVGREVREALDHLPGSRGTFRRRGEHLFMDLAAAGRAQLLAQGVAAGNMDVLGHCTSCEKDRFFSHRARGDEGRMISFIGTCPVGP